MNIKDFVKQVQEQKIDPVENIKKVLEEVKEINKDHHFMLSIDEEFAIKQAEHIRLYPKGKLAGVPVTVKDCICVKGIESRSGSRVLDGYKPPFMATAVQKLIDEGAIIIGKTVQDEFGFGSFSVNTGVDIPIPKNPVESNHVCGGSSGGSAGIAKKITVPHLSLAESTGGSIVAPASFCGVVGLTPTYGRVSRFGLMDYANSLDKIGPITKTVEESALMLEVISGADKLDSTSKELDVPNYIEATKQSLQGLKIGIIKEALEKSEKPSEYHDLIAKLKEQGAIIEEVTLPTTTEYGIACYYLIAMAEASTNLSKYCGLRYGATEPLEGSFNEYFSSVRSKWMGKEAKRRVIIGTFARMAGYRDAYYIRSMKVRTKIINEYKDWFKKFDVLLSPTMPGSAPKFEEVEKLTPMQHYAMDLMTVGPNVAGLPHITLNIAKQDQLPLGLMFIGDHFAEEKIIRAAAGVEKL